jgi:hypothetical protein
MAQIRVEEAGIRLLRGLHDLCDDLTMTVICPTCQTLGKCGRRDFEIRNRRCNLRPEDEKAGCRRCVAAHMIHVTNLICA